MIKKLIDIVDKTSYTHILGVSRGGLVPAVYISNKLNIPMLVTSYSSNEGNGDGGSAEFEWLDNKSSPVQTNSNILIVDDICDTGNTLKEIVQHVRQRTSGIVNTAVLHYRNGACYVPDFYAKKIQPNDPWVIYDWE